MQTIIINLPPIPRAESDPLESMSATRSSQSSTVEYPIAARRDEQFHYEHKIVLTTQGSVLQIMGKDAEGRITQALRQNAFPLDSQPLRLTLLDTFDDGTDYKLRIEHEPLPKPANTVVLSGNFNPQVQIGEVCFEQNGLKTWELDFIGTDDYRYSSFPRVIRRTGEPFQLTHGNGNIIIEF